MSIHSHTLRMQSSVSSDLNIFTARHNHEQASLRKKREDRLKDLEASVKAAQKAAKDADAKVPQ